MLESVKESFLESFVNSWGGVAELLPSIMGAIIVLLVGYLVAFLIRRLVVLIARRVGLNRASQKVGLDDILSSAGIQSSASEVVGTVLFWIILLSFLISSAETIGLESLSLTIRALVLYLPKVVAALLVLILGLLLASSAKRIVSTRFERIGVLHSAGIANAVYGLFVLVAGTMAVSQLELETDLLKYVIVISLVTVGLGLSLTVGLGTRDIAKNVLAGMYARDQYRPGSRLHLDGRQGELRKVGTVTTEIKTGEGQTVHIPNSALIENIVQVEDTI